MKNLTGYLNKIVLLSSLILFALSNTSPVNASDNFSVQSSFTHSLQDNTVDTEVVLTLTPDIDRVLTYYTATIPQENIEPECYDITNGKELECSTYAQTNATDILVDTDNAVVRTSNPLKIRLTYSTTQDLESSYNISSYVQDTDITSVVIKYPKTKGEPFWSSDTIQNIKTSGEQYVITIQNPTSENISFVFGNAVNYEFSMTRVLNNTLTGENQTFELIVPSDTETQTIIFDEISPLPNIATRDKSGNYIFKYIVAPETSQDITINGYIQMHGRTAGEINITNSLTEESGYWNLTDSSEIARIIYFLQKNKELDIDDNFEDITELGEDVDTELVLKYLNEYIVNRLSIKEDVTLGVDQYVRLGANNLVDNPTESSQEDYADFLIAILRNFNIPSRLKIGYISNISGYTSDGFYHTWVEAYDQQEQKWVVLDPFLEEYFEKTLFGSEFLDHLTILTRQESPVSPKLTIYESSDLIIKSVENSDIEPELNANVSLSFEKNNLISKYIKGTISFSNTGNIAITGYEILKSNFNATDYIDHITDLDSEIILPKQNTSISLNVDPDALLETVFVNVELSNSNSIRKDFLVETETIIEASPFLTVLSKLISVTIFALLIYLIYFTVKKILQKRKQ